MATKTTAPKLTAAQMKDKIIRLEDKVDSLKNGAWCYMCDTHKSRDKFYVSTDPLNKSGLTPICKDCAKKIALKIGKDKVEHEPDKDSVILALKYLDKPFLNDLWDASVLEADNLASGRVKSNPWNAYIKNVAMGQYNCKTFSDSDFYYSKKDENMKLNAQIEIQNKTLDSNLEELNRLRTVNTELKAVNKNLENSNRHYWRNTTIISFVVALIFYLLGFITP